MNKKSFARSLLLVVVVIGAAYGGYHYVTSAASGRVNPPMVKHAAANVAKRTTTINGQYASFKYPTVFTRTTSDPPVTPVLVNYSFIKQQIGSWLSAVQITHLATGSLSDDGSYNYRHVVTSRYTSQPQTVNGQPVVIFTDSSSQTFSKVAYLQHGNLDASISLNGGTIDDQAQLQTILQAMIASWHWN